MSTSRLPADLPGSAVEYYQDPNVRQRIFEYCGAIGDGPPSAAFVAGVGPEHGPRASWERGTVLPPSDLWRLWDTGCDVSRSLWDERDLVFLVDLDYQNPDQPAEPYLRPAEVFVKLEPVYRAVRRILARHDVHPVSVMTGRGYHFTGRVPLTSAVVPRLAGLVPGVPEWFHSLEDRRPPGVTAGMTAEQAAASVGLGLVIEFLAHQVLAEAQPESRIPVVLNGTVVGSGYLGRECSSIDFSHAGDPLDVRHFRMVFSTYQWHRLRPDIFGWAVAAEVPPLVALPRDRAGLLPMLRRGHGFAAALVVASTPVEMPDIGAGLSSLVDDYEASRLCAFHRDYLARRRRHAGGAPALDMSTVPPCVRSPFGRPNDLLLKPAHLQHVVRGLMAHGWDPVEIAVLVKSKYEEDHEWGARWRWMHPGTRADFDVRVFAGLIASGADALIDFNCVSAQEKELCPGVRCQMDLREERDQLRREIEMGRP